MSSQQNNQILMRVSRRVRVHAARRAASGYLHAGSTVDIEDTKQIVVKQHFKCSSTVDEIQLASGRIFRQRVGAPFH